MEKTLIIIQVVLAILLMISVLVQGRGSSLGEAFGGSGSFYGTRRGSEKAMFTVTVILAVAFVVVAMLNLIY